MLRPPPRSTLFPYHDALPIYPRVRRHVTLFGMGGRAVLEAIRRQNYDTLTRRPTLRSEEHTSELQSRRDLVCRLLLEKKKQKKTIHFRNLTTTISATSTVART